AARIALDADRHGRPHGDLERPVINLLCNQAICHAIPEANYLPELWAGLYISAVLPKRLVFPVRLGAAGAMLPSQGRAAWPEQQWGALQFPSRSRAWRSGPVSRLSA